MDNRKNNTTLPSSTIAQDLTQNKGASGISSTSELAALRDARKAALAAARRSVDIAGIAVSFAEINAQPVIDAIAVLANVDGLAPHHVAMRMRLIQGLAKVGSQLALDMVDCLGAEAETANADLAALEASAA